MSITENDTSSTPVMRSVTVVLISLPGEQHLIRQPSADTFPHWGRLLGGVVSLVYISFVRVGLPAARVILRRRNAKRFSCELQAQRRSKPR